MSLGAPGKTQSGRGSIWKVVKGKATWVEYRNVVRVCGDAMRKAEAHSELNLARDVKGFVRWWLSTCSALLLAMPHLCGYGGSLSRGPY